MCSAPGQHEPFQYQYRHFPLKINITVTDHVTPDLIAKMQAMGPEGMTDCHSGVGEAVARLMRTHFTARGGKTFWPRMARATSLVAADSKHAVVAVSDYAILGKIQETTVIRPKNGKKFIAIPVPDAMDETQGHRPSARLIKDTFCIQSKRGNFLIVRRDGSGIKPLWILKPQVTLHRDPNALPSDAEYQDTITKAVQNWLGTISRN